MTIRERFSGYSIEELQAALERISAKLDKYKSMMNEFKAERSIEMFQGAEQLYNETANLYLDIKCAIAERN